VPCASRPAAASRWTAPYTCTTDGGCCRRPSCTPTLAQLQRRGVPGKREAPLEQQRRAEAVGGPAELGLPIGRRPRQARIGKTRDWVAVGCGDMHSHPFTGCGDGRSRRAGGDHDRPWRQQHSGGGRSARADRAAAAVRLDPSKDDGGGETETAALDRPTRSHARLTKRPARGNFLRGVGLRRWDSTCGGMAAGWHAAADVASHRGAVAAPAGSTGCGWWRQPARARGRRTALGAADGAGGRWHAGKTRDWVAVGCGDMHSHPLTGCGDGTQRLTLCEREPSAQAVRHGGGVQSKGGLSQWTEVPLGAETESASPQLADLLAVGYSVHAVEEVEAQAFVLPVFRDAAQRAGPVGGGGVTVGTGRNVLVVVERRTVLGGSAALATAEGEEPGGKVSVRIEGTDTAEVARFAKLLALGSMMFNKVQGVTPATMGLINPRGVPAATMDLCRELRGQRPPSVTEVRLPWLN
jgi:hypothetical protein